METKKKITINFINLVQLVDATIKQAEKLDIRLEDYDIVMTLSINNNDQLMVEADWRPLAEEEIRNET